MNFARGMLAVALLVAFTSCEDEFGVVGNGRPETETRYARSFDRLSSSGPFQVYVSPGDEPSIEITAESNLLPYIETDFDGNHLRIRTRGMHDLHESLPIQIYLVSPQIKQLRLSGSGDIHAGNYSADHFSVVVSGSGEVVASVETQELDAEISGSGEIFLEGYSEKAQFGVSGSGTINAFDMALGDCDVTISGSGHALVNVENNLDVRISGSGQVHYINSPHISSSISGSGKVIDEN